MKQDDSYLWDGGDAPGDPTEVLMDLAKELARLSHRLRVAEGMLEICAGILKHGDTQEVKTSKKIFEWLNNKEEK